MSRNIIIAGATGFIGKKLSWYLHKLGYNVIVLSRNTMHSAKSLSFAKTHILLDEINLTGNLHLLESAKAMINLSGASIAAKQWTDEYKREIISSRAESGGLLAKVIEKLNDKPQVYLSCSGIGYYGTANDVKTEDSPIGNDFLAEVCKQWEEPAIQISSMIRTLICRIGVVLDKEEGAMPELIKPIKFFTGKVASGKQWISWIHINDLVRIFTFLIENKELHGIFNCCSVLPVQQIEFAKAVALVLNKPLLFSVPEFFLKFVLGERSMLVSKGQRVLPERLAKCGFRFEFNTIEDVVASMFSESVNNNAGNN